MAFEDMLEPMDGFLIVEDDKMPESVGIIHLPEQNSLRASSGLVLKPSPSLAGEYPKGTRLLFSPHAGEVLDIDGRRVKLLYRDEVQAVVRLPEKFVVAPV